jgi:outer membrane lipoprotein SlyB
MSAANPSQTPPSSLAAVPKAVWAVVGVLAIATAGLAGALVGRSSDKPAEPVAAVQPAQTVAAVPPQQLQPIAQPEPVEQPAPKVQQQAQVTKPKVKASTQHAAVAHPQPAPAPVQPQVVQQPQVVAQAPAPIPVTPVEARPAAICNTCGVVEAVREVKEKAAQGSGLGAVGGAVAGGLLGNQVGGGNGKKVMTVLGAIGGGLAGNEIEKQVKATTAYDVQVRMEDGSVRSLRRAEPVAVGTHVQVEGNTMRVSSRRHPNEPRTLRTSANGA